VSLQRSHDVGPQSRGYVVQIERTEARLAGGENLTRCALRATLIFRREEDTWELAHRHADRF